MIFLPENNFYNLDCREGMSKMKPNSVSLICTDPSFAINFTGRAENYNRKKSNVINAYHETKQDEYLSFTTEWLFSAKRVLKDSGSMYLFCSWNNLEQTLNALEIAGFQIINHIIWKYQFGVRTARKFTTSHYHVIYCCKKGHFDEVYFNRNARFSDKDKTEKGGSKRYQDMEDVWFIKREYWHGQKKTPTKLPREILSKIILYSSRKGNLVLDPFLGSGLIGVVCKKLGRKFIGFEIEKPVYRFATNLLKKSGKA